MVKDEPRRSEHFKAKLQPSVLNARITAEKEFMVQQVDIAYSQQVFNETKVKDYLEQIGFYGIDQHHYMNFAQEVWSICRKFRGVTRQMEVEIKATKWHRRGLSATHLLRLALLFGVDLTAWIAPGHP